jgi:hypothetical protein
MEGFKVKISPEISRNLLFKNSSDGLPLRRSTHGRSVVFTLYGTPELFQGY